MNALITSVLSYLAENFLKVAVGYATDEFRQNLKKINQEKNAKQSFEVALERSVQRYGSSGSLRAELTPSLLIKDGFLANEVVLKEIALIFSPDKRPNFSLIGEIWKRSIENPPSWRDFSFESKIFLSYLESELRASDIYRAAFSSKDLYNTSINSNNLSYIKDNLTEFSNMVDAHFSEMIKLFSQSSDNIREGIYDYTRLINEKSRNFTGRQFVFDAVYEFLKNHSSGYFFITGEPGIGKSAIASQIVMREKCVHHFNVKAEGINTAAAFLRNVCSQIIAFYKLDHSKLAQHALDDSGYLNILLGEVSRKLDNNEKALIVIDGLDEVDLSHKSPGTNPLFLPVSLPDKIYFVITSRPISPLRIECEQETLVISEDSIDNLVDIKNYLKMLISKSEIQQYLLKLNIEGNLFINEMTKKSQGNFMFLKYVIPEIENGAYKDLNIDKLPTGLENYYEDHWRRMRNVNSEDWFKFKLPVILALTSVKSPVSVTLIQEFSGIKEVSPIISALIEWRQFLHEQAKEKDGIVIKEYSVYHESFNEFLAKKDEVLEEQVNLKKAHKKIAESLWKEIYNDDNK
jgi:hypothetical protein